MRYAFRTDEPSCQDALFLRAVAWVHSFRQPLLRRRRPRLIDGPARPSAVPGDYHADTQVLASGLARGRANVVSHLRDARCVHQTLYKLQLSHTRHVDWTTRQYKSACH